MRLVNKECVFKRKRREGRKEGEDNLRGDRKSSIKEAREHKERSRIRREPALVVEGCNEREVGREGEKRHQKRASCGEKGEGEGGEETNDTKREEERDIVRRKEERWQQEESERKDIKREPVPAQAQG